MNELINQHPTAVFWIIIGVGTVMTLGMMVTFGLMFHEVWKLEKEQEDRERDKEDPQPADWKPTV